MSNLTKSDIRKVQMRSWFYQWQSFNYETMQGAGFTQAIGPAIVKIYEGDDDLIAEKLEKYMTFYNTESTMSQLIMGACLAIEETAVFEATDISIGIRTGLMGPFAGLGDSIFRVSRRVIFSSIIGYMAINGSALGIAIGYIVGIAFCLVRYKFFGLGYKEGVSFITTRQNQIKSLTSAAIILGMVVIGAMIPSAIKVTLLPVFQYGEAVQPIQDLVDVILPYLLPVLLTAGVYAMLGLKKVTTVRMVWIILAFSIVMTYLGVI